MTRRTERISSLMLETIGRILLSKLSDPRVDPARTSVTRVEVAEDLLTAKVFISVLGTEQQQRNAMRALRHAAGHIQELMKKDVQLRHTPVLSFEPDVRFKKTQETLQIIQRAMEELEQKEDASAAEDGGEGPDQQE